MPMCGCKKIKQINQQIDDHARKSKRISTYDRIKITTKCMLNGSNTQTQDETKLTTDNETLKSNGSLGQS